MQDNVNVSTRVTAEVRPFMETVLQQAEERLVEKQEENAPASWDDVKPHELLDWAVDKLDAISMGCTEGDDRFVALADAMNLIGMAYDTYRQLDEEAKEDEG